MNETDALVLFSLVKLIKKDPLVALQEAEDGSLEFFHLSGKKLTVVKESSHQQVEPIIQTIKEEADLSPVYQKMNDGFNEIRESLKSVTEMSKSLVSFEPQEIDYDHITSEVVKSFDYAPVIAEMVGSGIDEAKETLKESFSYLIKDVESLKEQEHITTDDIATLIEREISEVVSRFDAAPIYKRIDQIDQILTKEPDFPEIRIDGDSIYKVNPDGSLQKVGTVKHRFYGGVAGERGARGLSAYQVAVKNGFVGSESHWLDSLGCGIYTNSTPTQVTVGGISAGAIFDNVSFADFVEMMFYPVQTPTLINPSLSFVGTNLGFREIGSTNTSQFTTTFNRGSINPQYEALSPFRSGLPSGYFFTGEGLVDVMDDGDDDTPMQVVQTITIVVPNGTLTWTAEADYLEGVQPINSEGDPFDSPLPAGTTDTITRSLTGVYPVFATTQTITDTSKQPLMDHNTTVTVNMVREEGEVKQVIEFPFNEWNQITKLEQYNTAFERWSVIPLGLWTRSIVMKDINGNQVQYRRYTHNGSIVGARQLRWFT